MAKLKLILLLLVLVAVPSFQITLNQPRTQRLYSPMESWMALSFPIPLDRRSGLFQEYNENLYFLARKSEGSNLYQFWRKNTKEMQEELLINNINLEDFTPAGFSLDVTDPDDPELHYIVGSTDNMKVHFLRVVETETPQEYLYYKTTHVLRKEFDPTDLYVVDDQKMDGSIFVGVNFYYQSTFPDPFPEVVEEEEDAADQESDSETEEEEEVRFLQEESSSATMMMFSSFSLIKFHKQYNLTEWIVSPKLSELAEEHLEIQEILADPDLGLVHVLGNTNIQELGNIHPYNQNAEPLAEGNLNAFVLTYSYKHGYLEWSRVIGYEGHDVYACADTYDGELFVAVNGPTGYWATSSTENDLIYRRFDSEVGYQKAEIIFGNINGYETEAKDILVNHQGIFIMAKFRSGLRPHPIEQDAFSTLSDSEENLGILWVSWLDSVLDLEAWDMEDPKMRVVDRLFTVETYDLRHNFGFVSQFNNKGAFTQKLPRVSFDENNVVCHESCFRCNAFDELSCTVCYPGDTLYKNRCYSTCPLNLDTTASTYRVGSKWEAFEEDYGFCRQCHPSCSSCDAYKAYSRESCDYCRESKGFTYKNSKCVCEAGTVESHGKCTDKCDNDVPFLERITRKDYTLSNKVNTIPYHLCSTGCPENSVNTMYNGMDYISIYDSRQTEYDPDVDCQIDTVSMAFQQSSGPLILPAPEDLELTEEFTFSFWLYPAGDLVSAAEYLEYRPFDFTRNTQLFSIFDILSITLEPETKSEVEFDIILSISQESGGVSVLQFPFDCDAHSWCYISGGIYTEIYEDEEEQPDYKSYFQAFQWNPDDDDQSKMDPGYLERVSFIENTDSWADWDAYNPRIVVGGTTNKYNTGVDGSSFHGYIQNLKVFNKYYSPYYMEENAFRDDYRFSRADDSLVAWWRFNETTTAEYVTDWSMYGMEYTFDPTDKYPSMELLTLGSEVLPYYELGFKMEYCQVRDVADCIYFDDYYTKMPLIVPDGIDLLYEEEGSFRDFPEMYLHFAEEDQLENLEYETILFEEFDEIGLYQGRCEPDFMKSFYTFNEEGEYIQSSPKLFQEVDPGHYEVCYYDYSTEEMTLFSQLYVAMPPQGVFPANSASLFRENNYVNFTTFGDGVMADNDVIVFYDDCEELQDELNGWQGFDVMDLDDLFIDYAHIRRRDLVWDRLHSYLVDEEYELSFFQSFGMNSMCLLPSYNMYASEYYFVEAIPNALWSIQYQPFVYGIGSHTHEVTDPSDPDDNPWEVGVECNKEEMEEAELTAGLQWWDLVIYDGEDLDKRGGFFSGDQILFVGCQTDLIGQAKEMACTTSNINNNLLGNIEFQYNEWPLIWFGTTNGIKIDPKNSNQDFVDVCMCYKPKDTNYNSIPVEDTYLFIYTQKNILENEQFECRMRVNKNSDFLELESLFPPSKNYGIFLTESPYVNLDYKVYQTKPKDNSIDTYINMYMLRYINDEDFNMFIYPYFYQVDTDSTLEESFPITCQKNNLVYKEDYTNPGSQVRTTINGEVIFENANNWEKPPQIGASYLIEISLSAIKTPDDGVRSGQYLFGSKGTRDMADYVYGNKFIVQYMDYQIFPTLYKKHPSDTTISFKGENMSSVSTSWNWTSGVETSQESPRQMDWITDIFKVNVYVSSTTACTDNILPSTSNLRGIVNTYNNTDATISHLYLQELDKDDILCGNFSIKRISTFLYSEINAGEVEFFERWTFRDSILLGYIGCDSSCLTCSGTGPTYCIHCPEGYLYQDGSCVSSCTDGKVIIEEYFYADFPESVVEELQSTYPLLTEFPQMSCVDSCPDKTYPDPDTSECVSCNENCYSCSGVEANSCLSCLLGYYLYEGFCVTTCPMGFESLDGETCTEDLEQNSATPTLSVSIIDQNFLNKLNVDRDYYIMAKVLDATKVEAGMSASLIEWRIEDSLGIFTNDMFGGERFNTTVIYLNHEKFPDISYSHAFTLVINVQFGDEVATDSYVFQLYEPNESGDLSCTPTSITPFDYVYLSASQIAVGDSAYTYKLFYQIKDQSEMIMLIDSWTDETLSSSFSIPSFLMPAVKLSESSSIRFLLEVTDEFSGVFYITTDNRTPNIVVNSLGSTENTIAGVINYLNGISLTGITDAVLINQYAVNLYAVSKSYPKLGTADKICSTNSGCVNGECQQKRSVSYCLCDLGYTGKNCQYTTSQAASLVSLTANAFGGMKLLYSGQSIISVDAIELVSNLLSKLTNDPAFLEGGDTLVTLTLDLMLSINGALPETWMQIDEETLGSLMSIYSNVVDYCMDYYKALGTGSLLDDLDVEGTDLESEYNTYVAALATSTQTLLTTTYDLVNSLCTKLLWTLNTGGPTKDIQTTFITGRLGALKPDDIIDSVIGLPGYEDGIVYVPVGVFTGKNSYFMKQNDVRYKLIKWNADPFSFEESSRDRVNTDVVSIEMFEGQTETQIELTDLEHPLEIFIPIKSTGPSGYNLNFLKCLWYSWEYQLPTTIENVTYALTDDLFKNMTIDEINTKYGLTLTSASTEATIEVEIPGEVVSGYFGDGCGMVYSGNDYIICRCTHATDFAGVFSEIDSMDISVITGGISTEFQALDLWKESIGFYSIISLSCAFLFSVLISMVVEMRFLEKRREELINAKKPDYIKNLEEEEKEREARLNKKKNKKPESKKKFEERVKENHIKKLESLSGKMKSQNPDEQSKEDVDLKAKSVSNAVVSYHPGLGALPNQQGNHLLNMKNLEIHNHGNNVGFHNYMMSQMLGVDPKVLAEMRPDFASQLGSRPALGDDMGLSGHPDAQGGALVPYGAKSHVGEHGAKSKILDESGDALLTDDEIELKKLEEEKEKKRNKYMNMKMFKKDQAFAQKIVSFNKCSFVQLLLWTHPILNLPVLTSITLPRHPRVAMMFMYLYSHMFVNSMIIFFFNNPYTKPGESRAFQSMNLQDFLLSCIAIVISTVLVYIYYTIFKTSDLRIRMARTYPQLHKMM